MSVFDKINSLLNIKSYVNQDQSRNYFTLFITYAKILQVRLEHLQWLVNFQSSAWPLLAGMRPI